MHISSRTKCVQPSLYVFDTLALNKSDLVSPLA